MRRPSSDTSAHVLRRLRAAPGPISGEELSHELDVSRMAVSKAVAHLRGQGYEIASAPRRGYRLTTPTDRPLAAEVQPLLTTECVGHAWVYENTLGSTNRRAAELAQAGAPDGLVVVADAQTAGRGRLQRQWVSPPGSSLTFSVVLRPRMAPARIPQIALVAAVAVRRAVATAFAALPVAVKWPNDVWIRGHKLGGILCEMDAELDRVHHVVVGVGLNVNVPRDAFPETLRSSATSILLETGQATWRPGLLARILNCLDEAVLEWLQAEDLGPFLAELQAHSVLREQQIGIEQFGEVTKGRAAGIARDGRLQLRLPDGRLILIGSGDVHIQKKIENCFPATGSDMGRRSG